LWAAQDGQYVTAPLVAEREPESQGQVRMLLTCSCFRTGIESDARGLG